MKTGGSERVAPATMEANGGGATRRPAAAIPRLMAGVVAALACALAACGTAESGPSGSGQPAPGGTGNAGSASLTLDIDGDGEVTSHSDALLILRYTSGFRGEALVEGAVARGCKRCTADEISKYIDSL